MGQFANMNPPLQNGYTPLTQHAQSHAEVYTFRAENATANGLNSTDSGNLFSSSEDEEVTQLDGHSSSGSSHNSEGGNGQISRARPTASTLAREQANPGSNQWSLLQHPWDILGIPRSAMTTPVSSRSNSAAGRSAQATPNSAPPRGVGPWPANNSPNTQGGVRDLGRDNFPRSE